MAVLRQLWQHRRSGEVYAVELDGVAVRGACGPLDAVEQRADMLRQMPYDPELGRVIDAEQAVYILARPPELQRTTLHWTWKELQRWLNHSRPEIGLATMGGVRGFYKRAEGPGASFVPCGYTWRDVAVRLGAARH